MALTISGDSSLPYAPGYLTVNFADGEPNVSLDLSIDSGPVLLTIALDETGTASNVHVPVETTVGSHTLHAVTAS